MGTGAFVRLLGIFLHISLSPFPGVSSLSTFSNSVMSPFWLFYLFIQIRYRGIRIG